MKTKKTDLQKEQETKQCLEKAQAELDLLFSTYNINHYPLALHDLKVEGDEDRNIDFLVKLLTIITGNHITISERFEVIQATFFDDKSIKRYEDIRNYAFKAGVAQGFFNPSKKEPHRIESPVKTLTITNNIDVETERYVENAIPSPMTITIASSRVERAGKVYIDDETKNMLDKAVKEIMSQVDTPNQHVQKNIAEMAINSLIKSVLREHITFSYGSWIYTLNGQVDDDNPDDYSDI